MSVKPVGRWDVGSEEWHQVRTRRLGGSEVAAALGLSPWCSPFTLWHRKQGAVGQAVETPSMYWGKIHEPGVFRHFTTQHPEWSEQLWDPAGVMHADDWRIASPDRIGPVLWEGKTASAYDAWEWGPDGSDEAEAIPPYYRVQCIWYMDVLDRHDMILSVLIDNSDYREYTVPWDDEEAADIRKRAWEFWQTVINNERPPLDAADSTYQTVRELHKDINGEDVQVPVEVGETYLRTDLELKAITKDFKLAKTTLLDHMGQAKRALIADTPVARRQRTGKGDAIALYALHPKEDD
jgi:putative phage-type endonuclease